MGWDHIQQRWSEYKRHVRERWGRLAEHEVEEMAGRRDQLVVKLKDVYGLDHAEAEGQVREFESGAGPGRGA